MTAGSGSDPAAPRRTEPIGLLVRAVASLRQLIPGLIAVVFLLRDEGPWTTVALPAIAAVLAANVAVIWLKWRRFTYRVGEQDIRVDSGLVSRAARSVPYERIQDVSLEQGPLARLFGLVEVRFETGAGGKDELKLAYLKQAEGERLREVVRERREGEPAASLDGPATPAAAEPDEQVLFAMGPKRLVTFGLFEFSLAVVAVLAGAAQQFDFLLPFDPWDFDQWQHRLAGPGAWLAGLGPSARVVGGVFAALSLIAVGFATGLVRTILRDWDFTLDSTAKGFRRRRGLFTRTDVVMPAHRVQAVQVRTRWLRRRFGWHALRFVSLAQDAGSASHVVAPFARMDEIAPIAGTAGFALPEAVDWMRPSPRAYFDTALIGAAISGAIAIAVLFSEARAFAILPVLAGAFIAVRQYFLWRHDRNALDARRLYQRHGWLAPRLDVASRVKLQSVEIRQGPLARRRGYADLHLGLAGGKLAFEGLPLGRALDLRRAILESIGETDFSRLAQPG